MPVATFTQPNMTTQLGNAYKGNIDGGMSVFARIAGAFAPHEQSTPNMTVRLDAGYVFSGSVLTEVAAQSSATIAAPTTNPRIDRIVVDALTGAVSVVTGVQGASPAVPAIPAGKVPVAQVLLQTTSTVISNSMLTDERITFNQRSFRGALVYGSAHTNVPNNTGTPVNFDQEVYDTSNIHDPSTNNSRLTVPAGVSRVRLFANLVFSSNTTGYRSGQILVNVSQVPGAPIVTIPTMPPTGEAALLINTAVISVSPGNYFELYAYQNSGATLVAFAGSAYTVFGMEIIE